MLLHLIDNLKFFNLIHDIELKGTYSYNEILFVVKEIEKVLDQLEDKENVIKYLDYFYKELPSCDINVSKININRIRSIFHKPLKEAGINPLTTNPRAIELFLNEDSTTR